MYSDGNVYYRNEDGIGNWGDWSEYSGELTDNMKTIISDIDKLSANSEGEKLIDFFKKEENNVVISISENSNTGGLGQVKYQGKPVKLSEQGSLGYVDTPSYIVLGHELGHIQSAALGLNNKDQKWVDGTFFDEIYDTHIKNKIRSAAGMKLRDRYNLGDQYKLIDKDKNAYYIDKKESYPTYPLKGKLTPNEEFNYKSMKFYEKK